MRLGCARGWLLVSGTLVLARPCAGDFALFADGRDHYRLLTPHPLNRQLIEQLGKDDASFRLMHDAERLAALSDLSIGWQSTLDDTQKSRFHGFSIADSYAALRAFHGLDANANVLFLNPSASDGYRVSADIKVGLALHAYYETPNVEGAPIRFDVLGIDLGRLTVGAGLLVEETPAEGVMAGVRWRGFDVLMTDSGRTLWSDDDIWALELGALDRKLRLTFLDWTTHELESDMTLSSYTPQIDARYATLAVDLPIAPNARFVAEYAVKLGSDVKSGLLLRTDYVLRALGTLQIHAGYQFRYYAQGFGPRKTMVGPTSTFNVPAQEDQYVTNSFEYFGLSPDFEQWSHTLMLEGRLRVLGRFEPFADTELWDRFARGSGEQVVYTPDGFRAPGGRLQAFYRAGLRFLPWSSAPHRFSAYATNKQVESGLELTDPVSRRFVPGNYWVFELEAFL